jgi:uncharacterized damage-inducible protein DinB
MNLEKTPDALSLGKPMKGNSMGARQPNSELVLLVRVLDEAYDKKAWHGPNLKGTIRRLDAEQAAWRPKPERHSIAEIVLHTAYWKYSVRRRLRGDSRGSFPVKGSNWFPLPNPLTAQRWREYLALVDTEHRILREAVAGFLPNRLHQIPAGSKVSYSALIYGVAHHDVYHAGQIQLLRRLQADQ